jgi:hemerythrin-like metal-binding protein
MPEFLDVAAAAHTLWKLRLRVAIERGNLPDRAKVDADDACDLGRWLHASGATHRESAEFRQLTICHAEFHHAAGRVVGLINEGKHTVALDELERGEFAKSSASVIVAIEKLKRARTIAIPPDTGGTPLGAEWTDLPQLGIAELDREHQEILRTMTTLRDALGPNATSVRYRKATLDELARYIQDHFATEEALMLQSSYPDYSNHKSEHEFFLERICQLQKNESGGSANSTLDTLNMLGNYLHHHVLEMDRGLVPHLINLKIDMRRQNMRSVVKHVK